MLVADLQHFLNMPDDVPGPARALAAQLSDIVRAATAGAVTSEWTTALPCKRRPARTPCLGRIALRRNDSPSSIDWWSAGCGDEGVISNWEATPYDLRRRPPVLAEAGDEVVIAVEVAAALRGLLLLDADCERVVFAARAHRDGAILTVGVDTLDHLIDAVAAEANHAPDRRRQRALDAAYDGLMAATRGGV